MMIGILDPLDHWGNGGKTPYIVGIIGYIPF